jgi:hypothetical protein
MKDFAILAQLELVNYSFELQTKRLPHVPRKKKSQKHSKHGRTTFLRKRGILWDFAVGSNGALQFVCSELCSF